MLVYCYWDQTTIITVATAVVNVAIIVAIFNPVPVTATIAIATTITTAISLAAIFVLLLFVPAADSCFFCV